MRRRIAVSLLALVAPAALAVAACAREKPGEAGRSSVSASLPVSGTAGAMRAWDDSLGNFIVTPSIETGAPTLFARDTSLSAAFDVELFSHEALTVRATLRPGASVSGCAWKRTATLGMPADQLAPVVWSLALAPGIATPLAIDLVSELLPRDSSDLVTRIHRLVSALPDDSVSAPFRGLPVVVRDAWRFSREDGSYVAVAVATRALNLESNPRAEVVTLIAEPDSAAGQRAWRTVFARRVAGPEDRVEGSDLLAAIRLSGDQTAVVLVRESEGGAQVDVVERTTGGAWRVRWSSASLPCFR